MEFKDALTEVKADVDGGYLEGHAAGFDSCDSDEEVIERGAFEATIAERFPKNLIKVLWNHGELIGRPVELSEDSTGLYFKARISPTQLGKDVLALVRDGACDRMSFGFNRQIWERDETVEAVAKYGKPVTRLRQLKLYEISPVIFPANEHTDVSLAGKFAGLDRETARELLDALKKLSTHFDEEKALRLAEQAAKAEQESTSAVTKMVASLLREQHQGWGKLLQAAGG